MENLVALMGMEILLLRFSRSENRNSRLQWTAGKW
jgi:hypothetical protein